MSGRVCDIAGCSDPAQCRVRRAGVMDLWTYVCNACRRNWFDRTVQVEAWPKKGGRR